MKTVTVVFGLPGAGKSTYIESNLAQKVVFDDLSVLSKDKKIEDFLKEIKNLHWGDDIVLSDPMLCLKKNQEKLLAILREEFSEHKIHWIFIDTSFEVAKKRAIHDSLPTLLLLKNQINIDELENLEVIKDYNNGKRNHKKI